jgi:hypothetical protein
MTKVLATLALVLTASVAFGATVSVVDVAPSDVPGPQPITVFPPPSAASFVGAHLLFDNSAELALSAGYANASERNFLTFPLTAANITINSVTYQGQWSAGGFKVLAVNNALPGSLYTNCESVALDNRFPTHIPRPGRYAAYDYTAVEFVFDHPMTAFGVYTAMNSNQWKDVWGIADDNNRQMINNRKLWVGVLREGDTFATAQYVQVTCSNMYAPFIKVVASDKANLIKSVCVVQDSSVESDAPFGFFDVYVQVPTDVNADGAVDVVDLLTFVDSFGLALGDPGYDATCDFNGDNAVDVVDLLTLVDYFGKY